MTLYQYCRVDGCTWTATWEGGSAAGDPALDHLTDNPDHTVMGGASAKHRDRFEAQQDGANITRDSTTGVVSDA